MQDAINFNSPETQSKLIQNSKGMSIISLKLFECNTELTLIIHKIHTSPIFSGSPSYPLKPPPLVHSFKIMNTQRLFHLKDTLCSFTRVILENEEDMDETAK